MGKSLVIVESPAKAKTINKYLGSSYVVKSSIGHIRDLPTGGQTKQVDPGQRAREAAKTRKLPPEEKALHRKRKARAQLVSRMGIDPDRDWEANYQVLPGKEKVVEELRRLARSADAVYLATDLDREGEAIAWHLKEAIGGDDSKYRRVVFNEITSKAIREAFERPGQLNLSRVYAQQARRFLDRVVGYMGSPLLWAKIARNLSMGRVQSVAVRLIVQREREIRAFVPEEYWELFAHLQRSGDAEPVRFQVVKQDGENFRPGNEELARAAMARLEPAEFRISGREDRPTRVRPSAPYITSTLQQAASTRLGFGVKKTMMLAQRLYEAGYITYMRTDSTNLSEDAINDCRALVLRKFGERYVPKQPRIYASGETAQEAHEAIRPSDVAVEPGSLSGMEPDAERLYNLVWRQFVACQMPPAEYLATTVTVMVEGMELRARGRIQKFDGFTRVQPRNEEDTILPDFGIGDVLGLDRLEPVQHFTKPPPRYNEASLVRELEKRGIGRPSTYAAIISKIQERGYVTLDSRRFYASKIGEVVTDRLVENFEDLMDYGFTASLEEGLDRVSSGETGWKELLNKFYQDFAANLEKAQSEDGMRGNHPTQVDIECPSCGRPMCVRTGSTGAFLGCSGYSLPPKERCKDTRNLVPGNVVVSADADDEEESRILRERRRCQLCDTAMDSYLVDEKRKLHVCGNNPDCPGFEVEHGSFRIKGYDGPTLDCDKCGSEMQLKAGRFGKYFDCTNAECKNTRKLLSNGQPAPPKMDLVPMPELRCRKVDDHYVLRDGAAGIFLAASRFPKLRETRAPFVDELIPHQNEIDPKYQFLMSAPLQDPDGRRSQVRYSRKSAEHYVTSELEDGKPSGWRVEYQDGRWMQTVAPRQIGGAAARSKSSTKKTAASRKTTTKKTTVKKTAAKKAVAKKTAVKKATTKKTAAKKTATKKTVAT